MVPQSSKTLKALRSLEGEKRRRLYEFFSTTSFHGLDFIRPDQSLWERGFWALASFTALFFTLYIAGFLFASFNAQNTGVNQVVMETLPVMPSIRVCNDAFLPSRMSHYPDPLPQHVYELLQSPRLLDILDYTSSLWRMSQAKAKRKAADRRDDSAETATSAAANSSEASLKLSSQDEDLNYAGDVYAFARPDNDIYNATYRTLYRRLLTISNSSSFVELILKLLPQARFPVVLHNPTKNTNDASAWSRRQYLSGNRREVCQAFLPNATAKPSHLDLLLVYPPIFVLTEDVILGRSYFNLRDSQQILLHHIERPMIHPGPQGFISPDSASFYVANGRVPQSEVVEFVTLWSTRILLSSRHYNLLKRRTYDCIPGEEPSPTVRAQNRARKPRVPPYEQCTPMDQALIDTEDPTEWNKYCDPWEFRDLEFEFFKNVSGINMTSTEFHNLPDKILPKDLANAYDQFIGRPAGDTPSPRHCESGLFSTVQTSTTREPFYSVDALLESAFQQQEALQLYKEPLKQEYAAFAQPLLNKVRLEIRGLPGDNVIVEQFLIMGTDTLFSQLGGFIGLFIGGSVLSLVHLLYSLLLGILPLQAIHQRFSRAKESIQPERRKRLCCVGVVTALLAFAVLFTAVYFAVGETEEPGPVASAPKAPFSRSAFYNFSLASVDFVKRSCVNYGSTNVVNFTSLVRSVWTSQSSGHLFYNFTSLNFPNEYPESAECEWLFVARPRGFPISFNAVQFETEPVYDFLEFYDSFERLRQRCSGNGTCAAFETAPGDFLRLRFHSDAIDSRSGFRAEVKVNLESQCPDLKDGVRQPGVGVLGSKAAFEFCQGMSRRGIYRGTCVADMERRMTFAGAFCHCRARGGYLPAPLPHHNISGLDLVRFVSLIRTDPLWLSATRDMEAGLNAEWKRDESAILSGNDSFHWHTAVGDIAFLPNDTLWARAQPSVAHHCAKLQVSSGRGALYTDNCMVALATLCMFAHPEPGKAPNDTVSLSVTPIDGGCGDATEIELNASRPRYRLELPPPGFLLYDADSTCSWPVKGPSDNSVFAVIFDSFEILRPDRLRLEGDERSNQICDGLDCPIYLNPRGTAQLVFTSDSLVNAPGFVAYLQLLSLPTDFARIPGGILGAFADTRLIKEGAEGVNDCAALCAATPGCTSAGFADDGRECFLQNFPRPTLLAVEPGPSRVAGFDSWETLVPATVRPYRDCSAETKAAAFYECGAGPHVIVGNRCVRRESEEFGLRHRRQNWFAARGECAKRCGYLATLPSADEQVFAGLAEMSNRIWLGGFRFPVPAHQGFIIRCQERLDKWTIFAFRKTLEVGTGEGWLWATDDLDPVSLNASLWAAGGPDDEENGQREDCLILSFGKFDDQACSLVRDYACMYDRPSDQT